MLVPLVLFYLFTAVSAVDPVVDANYASYKGIPLSNGITQWLGMRYAAAPVGNLRFAAPQDPPWAEGVRVADKVAPSIPSLTAVWLTSYLARPHLPCHRSRST